VKGPRTVTLGAAGLWTDPNPHGELPDGAMRVADDIVIRREGVIQPREGFSGAHGSWFGPADTWVHAIIPFGSRLIAGTYRDEALLIDSADGARWLTNGSEVTGFDAAPGPDTLHRGHAQARGSLYVTDHGGVRKVTSNIAGTSSLAGMPKPGSFSTALLNTADNWLPTVQSVTYRVVLRRTDANGYIMRSPPSGRIIIRNSDGASRAVQVFGALPAGVVVGDVVEVYRSTAVATSDPADDLYLAGEVEIDAGLLALGTWNFVDLVAEGGLARACYTNVGQEGAESSKYRPPRALDIALYQGSMFFANTTSAHVLEVAIVDMTKAGFGLGGFAVSSPPTADFTLGSATLTNVVNVAALRPGTMLLASDGGGGVSGVPGSASVRIAADTYVVSTDASTNTAVMSKPALATASAIGLLSVPWIQVDDTRLFGWVNTGGTAPHLRVQLYSGTTPVHPRFAAQELARILSSVYKGTGLVASSTGTNAKSAVLLLESDHAYGEKVSVTGAPRDAFAPLLDTVEPVTSAQDVRGNRLYWSQVEEPEAVAPPSFVDIGHEATPILRIVPTSDALWIVKADGIWRLTGSGADAGWRVDLRYPDVRVLGPRAVAAAGDLVWAWAHTGVVAWGDTGLEQVSARQLGASLRAIEAALAARPPTVNGGPFVRSHDKEHEVVVGVPAAAADTAVPQFYIFNRKTRAWVRWVLPFGAKARDVVAHPGSHALLVALEPAEDDIKTPDYTVLQTVLADGDRPDSVIEWQARSAKDPFLVKRWARGDLAFATARGVTSVELSWTSDVSNTAVAETVYAPLTAPGADIPTTIPAWAPRAHNFSTVLYARATITHDPGAWELVGLSLQYEPGSVQPRRTS
jgi:hypothetical protein